MVVQAVVALAPLVALLVKHNGVPPECFDSNPPSAACVNQVLPWCIGSLAALLIYYIAKTFFFDKPPKEALQALEKEYDKRHEVLDEMLQELEDLAKEEVEDEHEIGLIKFKEVWERVFNLLEMPNYNKKSVKEGVRWTFILYEKELRIMFEKTKDGQDVKYASGDLLSCHVKKYTEFTTLTRLEGFKEDKDYRTRVRAMRWEAQKYLKIHDVKTIVKAFKMVMIAREAFFWVVMLTICTTVGAMVSASRLYYRAEVLENLNDTEGDAFWEASKAMTFVELLTTAINLVTDMVRIRADSLAEKESEVAYFNALLKMPVSWWASQNELDWSERASYYTVEAFGTQITDFLAIPQRLLSDLITALTYAYLIIQTSSGSLLFLIAVNVGSGLVFWLLGIITGRLEDVCTKGVIFPSQDDWSYYYAFEPEYISTFLSFVRGPTECEKYASMKQAYAEYYKRRALVSIFHEPVGAVISQTSQVAQFSRARTHAIGHGMGIAEADAMVKSTERFVDQTESIRGLAQDVVSKAKPLAKAYDLITLPKAIDPDKGLWPKERAKGHIEFQDVRFKYPRRSNEILKGATFDVQPGETIGMTGSAGCGKSTCMRLLERFYDVTDGKILLDGVDIREYNPRWLRSQIATVAQEPTLLPLTIRENLTFGCSREPSLEEIYDACRAANIYDSLMDKDKFPSGLRTQLEAAPNVSGGEKQRIAIARAILADPPILLLDEATSALDEENQEKVQDALNKMMRGRTTLMIAHRLSTIKNSSSIIAFHKGRVVEKGTHDELLKQEGSLYRKLWNKQCGTRNEEEVDDDLIVEEEEEMAEQTPVEAGMNPTPSALTRLECVVMDLPESDPKKKELQVILETLDAEARLLAKEKHGRPIPQRGIQRTSVDQSKWKHRMSQSTPNGGPKSSLKNKPANKVIFQEARAVRIARKKLESLGHGFESLLPE